MGGDRGEFVPPTYDLRELGEGPAIYERLEALADRMLAVAGAEVGCAFAHVPVFAEQARAERALVRTSTTAAPRGSAPRGLVSPVHACCYTLKVSGIITSCEGNGRSMTRQRFEITKDAPGRLVKNPQGGWVFLPNPLPPEIDLGWPLVTALSAADRALAELAGVGGTLPNPHLLIGPFVRREAVLSSRIEGTQASLSDLFFFEAAPQQHRGPEDVREVANYVNALEYGLKRIETLPISSRLIRELHGHLMAEVRGGERAPGELRRVQNWIGPEGCSLDEATYVPPPPQELPGALGALEEFIHGPSDLPPLIRFALVHYQFEAIHPFLDGNGRIGRLLITLGLGSEGLLPHPLLYLSDFFEKNRKEYYRLLLAVTTHGRWEPWIRFFLRGVADQSRDAILRARALLVKNLLPINRSLINIDSLVCQTVSYSLDLRFQFVLYHAFRYVNSLPLYN